ncbi:MAG: 3-hydroxybutyryl-CoA dehydrogenase [Saprospiraceae bacterium]
MKKVAVIGAGTMGNGIAHVFAQNGHSVSLIDINEKALQKALITIEKNLDRMLTKNKITIAESQEALQKISIFTAMDEGIKGADLVIEAATENGDIKAKIFKTLDEITPATTILATNTSSISITKIGATTSRPDKVIGMHFFNPVPIMKLVEIIRGYATSDETTALIMDMTQKIGKVPVEVNDYPGFAANRILMPMINEAIYTLNEGVAGVEEIDTVMKLGMGHPMGPLQLADFVGLDVCLSILQVLQQGFGTAKYAPCPLLVNMVTAGKLGKKSGEGFYNYSAGGKDMLVSAGFV